MSKFKKIISLVFGTVLILGLIESKNKVWAKQPDVPRLSFEQRKLQRSPTRPTYSTNEILVKLKSSVPRLKRLSKIARVDDFSEPVNFTEIDQTTLFKALIKLNQKQPVKNVVRVFKNSLGPEADLQQFKTNISVDIERSQRKINETELQRQDLTAVYKITFNSHTTIKDRIRELQGEPEVEIVEPNYVYHLDLVPDDPYYRDHFADDIVNRDPNWNPSYDYQWNLKLINMEQAWDLSTNASSIIVAVIDTGIDYTHPEFGSCSLAQVNSSQCVKIAPGKNYISNNVDPKDDVNHGTFVAGTIAAITNNQMGIAGIAANARILPLKVFDQQGNSSADTIAEAIVDAVNSGARVVNASWGGLGESQIVVAAIEYAFLHGVVFVNSAGNSADNASQYLPANFTCSNTAHPERDCTITVAATSNDYIGGDERAFYSNWGLPIDLSAPGGGDSDILSLKSTFGPIDNNVLVSNAYLRAMGTSMAAPHVTGLVALILGKNPGLTPDEVRYILLNGVDDKGWPGFDGLYGAGRINAGRTLTEMDSSARPTARIEYPYPEFLVGSWFNINGSAFGQGFENFQIEISDIPEGQNWLKTGISLTNLGSTPIYNGTLASADLNALADGAYFLRLSTTAGGKTTTAIQGFHLDKQVKTGFPISFGSSFADQKPLVADLNSDGQKEIIFKNSREAILNVVGPDGKVLAGWPKTTGEQYSEIYQSFSPVAVDLDQNFPGLEVVLPVSETGNGMQLIAFHNDGTFVNNWTIADWHSRGDLPILFDTIVAGSDNGKPFVVYAEDSAYDPNGFSPMIHIFGYDGRELTGWPISLASTTTTGVSATPLVADLDADNHPEIIVIYKSRNIQIYSISGNLIRDFSLPLNEAIAWGIVIPNSIAVGDIDGDNKPEIVAAVNRIEGNFPEERKIYVWDGLGNLKTNWPLTLTLPPEYQPEDKVQVHNLNLGDFNGDGKADIMVNLVSSWVNGQYLVFDGNAKILSGFPIEGGTNTAFKVNASLTNNHHVWADDWISQIRLFDYNPTIGSINQAAGFPKTLSWPANRGQVFIGSLVMDDLDQDQMLDYVVPVVFGGYITPGNNFLYAFDTGLNYKTADWPQYLHDAMHTNTYNTLTNTPILGDLNYDGKVDYLDIKLLLGSYLLPQVGDFNRDGKVNAWDYARLTDLLK